MFSTSLDAVNIMIGTSLIRLSLRISCNVSIPSKCGIIISSRTRLICCWRRTSKPSIPLSTPMTSQGNFRSRIILAICKFISSSSITKTFFFRIIIPPKILNHNQYNNRKSGKCHQQNFYESNCFFRLIYCFLFKFYSGRHIFI